MNFTSYIIGIKNARVIGAKKLADLNAGGGFYSYDSPAGVMSKDGSIIFVFVFGKN